LARRDCLGRLLSCKGNAMERLMPSEQRRDPTLHANQLARSCENSPMPSNMLTQIYEVSTPEVMSTLVADRAALRTRGQQDAAQTIGGALPAGGKIVACAAAG
jgi:hypothetical protein